jgi:hypothetical protein
MFQAQQAQSHDVINALQGIRQEWQEAAGSSSLLDVESNLGLLLANVINHLNLSVDVQVSILGNDLFQEMKDLLKNPSRN